MREIKFRGKSRGKWVYGSLSVLADGHPLIIDYDDKHIYEVETDTVGQFTGKYDCTTVTEIYEGDILYSSKAQDYFAVEWDKASARLILKNESATADWLDGNEYEFEYEVVGDIYDNPELVKGE